MDDLIKTVKAQLYDRLSSPLVFSFVLSWAAWNYKTAVIILSSLSPVDKFFQLEMLSLQWESMYLYWAVFGFFGPASTVALYIFALPFFEEYVFEFTLKKKRALKVLRQKIEDETPISLVEARELRTALSNAQLEFDMALTARHEEIARLKVEVRELRDQMTVETRSPKPTRPMAPKKALTDTQVEILRKVANSPTPTKLPSILKNAGRDRLEVQYDLDELMRQGLISDEFGNDEYLLTTSGRALLIESLTSSTSPSIFAAGNEQ